ncbi:MULTISPECIES: hypothetical protein [unclassified Pseudomonas]|uniref:hypothetical protein n=1 Tax=unclassified Pseudomonas TaxID=196821 RepID=UPI002447E333|nr:MULTISPECIES: hypothetical protein [unclassified Pseudomonas]MDG9925006.1 hypothetical protein [Pseudomonas sp. GD04045]MDH0036287.1 hypothetical protein [Pseudomonas sp. GD04019]
MSTINPWKKFINLLPGGRRAVGEVISVSTATGSSVVELRNGTQILVLGVSVPVGSLAFVLDGQITGPAPSLPQYDIEV